MHTDRSSIVDNPEADRLLMAGSISEWPVIRPESGATLAGALELRTDQPKDFIRRGGRPWDRAAQRGAQARNSLE